VPSNTRKKFRRQLKKHSRSSEIRVSRRPAPDVVGFRGWVGGGRGRVSCREYDPCDAKARRRAAGAQRTRTGGATKARFRKPGGARTRAAGPACGWRALLATEHFQSPAPCCFAGGTGSNPPGWNGWHLRILLMANHTPYNP